MHGLKDIGKLSWSVDTSKNAGRHLKKLLRTSLKTHFDALKMLNLKKATLNAANDRN